MTAFELLVMAIPGLPLAAAALATADRVSGGRLLGARLLARVAVWGVGLSAAAATVAAVVTFADPAPRLVVLGTWLQTGSLQVDLGLLLDPLSAVMALTVAGLSWLVARFSVNYLHNEVGVGRYFTILPLFVGAMLLLVLAENYLLLFVAWEVVGACSYLLIAFYRDRNSAVDAGTRAFILNRIGDAGLLAGIFLLAVHYQVLSFSVVLASPLPAATATAVGLCFLIGATGKSAQVPLGGWLARAMEGPTPSSALIHGATMVTAGVYLVVRSAPLYEQAPIALVAVGVIGAVTALYGQLVGLAQTDIKGMLAASTNAHLGFMLLLCGLGLYPIAVFHLVAHAFYKTNLFLTAPSILHHLHGGPDPTAVARPADTARVPALLVGLAATLLLTAPLWVRPLQLPLEFVPGLTILSGLAVVAAFGLWFSARRMVRATFHDERRARRRTAIAVATAVVLVAAGAALGLQPGGIDGSWFVELLAPTLTSTTTAFQAPAAFTALLVAALICLAVSGIVTPRYFDRFRAERPAGSGGALARRLYFAAANRMWLDDLADRATAAVIRAGTAVDRFDRAVFDSLTGPPLPSAVPAREVSWEARLAAAAADTAEPPRPELAWLRESGAAPPQLEGAQGRPSGSLIDRIGSATVRVEREITAHGGGLYGALTNAMSKVSERLERVVFQRGIESVLERFTAALAAFSEGLERQVFELGPARVVKVGDRLRQVLLLVETLLGRPAVVALLALSCLVVVWLAR